MQDARTETAEGSRPRELKIAQRAAEYPLLCRGIYRKAMTAHSRKAAMDAFCIMCMGYQSHEVKRCTDPACPLYPYRSNIKKDR